MTEKRRKYSAEEKVWIDPNKLTVPDPPDGVSDMEFAPGVGCWFDRKPHEGIIRVCEKPYE